MKSIMSILFLLIIGSAVSLKAQSNDSLAMGIFEGKRFKTNEIIGLKDFKYNPLVTNIVLSESTRRLAYGNISTFENGVFSSGNYGPCGNECRVSVSGKYRFEGNKIQLFMETIYYWKECSDLPEEIINKEIGTFTWNENEDGTITLTSDQ